MAGPYNNYMAQAPNVNNSVLGWRLSGAQIDSGEPVDPCPGKGRALIMQASLPDLCREVFLLFEAINIFLLNRFS